MSNLIHEVPEIILEQLQASRVNGFPFFAYTGIKKYILYGNEELILHLPTNPSKYTSLSVVYDRGQDLYDIIFKQSGLPIKKIQGIYCDQMAEIIIREMGIN